MTSSTSVAERGEFRDAIRAFLRAHSDEAVVRTMIEGPLQNNPAVWHRMAEEMELQGLNVPEDLGGSGLGAVEANVVLSELGRALTPVPYLSSAVMATHMLLALRASEEVDELLGRLASGELVMVAIHEPGIVAGDFNTLRAHARSREDAFVVSVPSTLVIEAHVAGMFLVPAWDGDEISLFVVDASDPQIRVESLEVLDASRRVSRVTLEGAAAKRIGQPGRGWTALQQALIPTVAGLSAEQVGVARKALEIAVEYSRVREQFGRKIGSFQAIKQKCADLMLMVEASEAMSLGAAAAIDSGSSDAAALSFMALAHCSDTAVYTATEAIEVLGGVGFTWEHSIHFYFKRAMASSAILGTPMACRERGIRELGR